MVAFGAVVEALGACRPALASFTSEMDAPPTVAVEPEERQRLMRARRSQPAQEPKVQRLQYDERPWTLQVRFGLGTTVGGTGLVGEWDVADRFNVGMGLGFGLLPERGRSTWSSLEPGAHLRVRPWIWGGRDSELAIIVEYGVSSSRSDGEGLGPGCWENCESNPIYQTRRVVWQQLELGIEYRLRVGYSFRLSTGDAWYLWTPDWQCHSEEAPQNRPCGAPSVVLPTLTMAT
jgi:hypothetical protein